MEIKDFNSLPDYIQEQMLDNQEAQTGTRNRKIFEHRINTHKDCGGFNYAESPQGREYWINIIYKGILPQPEYKEGEPIRVKYKGKSSGIKIFLKHMVVNGVPAVLAITSDGYEEYKRTNMCITGLTIHTEYSKINI